MNYIPSAVLFIESVLSIYLFLVPRVFSDSSPLSIILGLIFLIAAVIGLNKKYQNRLFQWVTIIFSLIMGPGGFIGVGGISALVLAVVYIILSKKQKKAI